MSTKEAADIGNRIFKQHQAEAAALDMPAMIQAFSQKPLISVIMLLCNSQPKLLKATVKSLQKQSYANWELCVADDGLKSRKSIKLVMRMAKSDERIRLTALEANESIHTALNKALEMAKGEFIALMNHSDELTYDALFWMANEINNHPDTDFIYSDECKIGRKADDKYDFCLKPDWSPTLLLNYMTAGHLTVYKASLVRKLGGFRSEYGFSQDFDTVLQMADAVENPRHIERILYLCRNVRASSVETDKDLTNDTNLAALNDWHKRNGADMNVKVSIIIPSDSHDNVTKCINDIAGNTSYPSYEIVVVTNSKLANQLSGEFHTLDNLIFCIYDKRFNFSDKCNEGAALATGDVLCFYNDDISVVSEDWLERMVEVLILPGVGAVTPLLLEEQGDIIHSAGIYTGSPEAGFIHCAFVGVSVNQAPQGYINHHLLRDVSVVHGACTVTKKTVFNSIDGFDAINTPNLHSDIDFSFRLREKGYRCVYTPHAKMRHCSHGTWDAKTSKEKSLIYCLERWGHQLARDPYFTQNMNRLYYLNHPFNYGIFIPTTPVVRKPESRDILVISSDLSFSDISLELIAYVRTAIENGDLPVVLSLSDGPLREKYIDIGITVIVDESLQSPHRKPVLEYFARAFDLIVVNTIAFKEIVSTSNDSVPPVEFLPTQ